MIRTKRAGLSTYNMVFPSSFPACNPQLFGFIMYKTFQTEERKSQKEELHLESRSRIPDQAGRGFCLHHRPAGLQAPAEPGDGHCRRGGHRSLSDAHGRCPARHPEGCAGHQHSQRSIGAVLHHLPAADDGTPQAALRLPDGHERPVQQPAGQRFPDPLHAGLPSRRFHRYPLRPHCPTRPPPSPAISVIFPRLLCPPTAAFWWPSVSPRAG